MKTFLSSTSIDLVEHRHAVTDALERLGQQVERMEIFGARSEDPVSACLAVIRKCDVFVGIYAHRYGFVPEGSAISITETEFSYASELGMPTFCYLIDPKYPWPQEMKDTGQNTSKFDIFKKRISSALVYDTFTSPDNLAYKVASAVGAHFSINNQSDSAIAEISPLRPPFQRIEIPNGRSDSPLKLKSIIEGQSRDVASRLFDIIVENPTRRPALLTDFVFQWSYYRGTEESVDEGHVIRPVAKYILEIPIDTFDAGQNTATEAIYPTLVIPIREESGPGLASFRLQLHYYFSGRCKWHPCGDWNISFWLQILDDSKRALTVFKSLQWRNGRLPYG